MSGKGANANKVTQIDVYSFTMLWLSNCNQQVRHPSEWTSLHFLDLVFIFYFAFALFMSYFPCKKGNPFLCLLHCYGVEKEQPYKSGVENHKLTLGMWWGFQMGNFVYLAMIKETFQAAFFKLTFTKAIYCVISTQNKDT